MIFMLDSKDNLLQANLFVKDQDGLFDLLTQLTDSNYLGENGNYNVVSCEKKSSFGSLVYFGNFKNDDMLVKNYQVSYHENEFEPSFEYKQDIVRCMNLNSVLLFFNLLNNDFAFLIDELAFEFFNVGIFKKQSLDVVWNKFVSNLENEDSVRDLNNFRYALENNLIGVSIENTWNKEEVEELGILQKNDISLEKVKFITDIFNVSSSLVRRKVS